MFRKFRNLRDSAELPSASTLARQMLNLSDEQQKELAEAVKAARGNRELAEAVSSIYARTQQAIDARKPRCDISGRCCRFEDFGHRLFVTTAELAVFADQMPLVLSWDGLGCPYQVNKLCTVHAIRPFGCRIFFCDPTAGDWQQQQYERFHAELKQLHETFQIPYFYVEWRAALGAVHAVLGQGDGA